MRKETTIEQGEADMNLGGSASIP
uniref:Uncharacterized protein n=1 Tax=Arundo donax TaxID=35708 RepID=A0A0A9FZE3_ARUDO